jgi:anti-anti-sigma factor
MRPSSFLRRRRSASQQPRGRKVARLHGDLDSPRAAATGRRLVRLVDTGAEVLEVDLADVPDLSSDGCAALFTALRAAWARGTRMVITTLNRQVQSSLWQIGLLRAFADGEGRSE